MKTLFLDIETAPNIAHVWGLWDQNVSVNQLMESSYTMCWAAKWAGEKGVLFDSTYQSSAKHMVRGVHKLLDAADVVVHYHGSAFDIPTVNKEFLIHGLPPPSPVKQIDLLKVVKEKFRFPSNKLDYVSQRLGLGKKFEHEGHSLWVKCMNNDPIAWKQMEEYNKHDVILLEGLYYRVRPWIKGHPNSALLEGGQQCPTCNSLRYHKRGFAYTNSYQYQRYQCLDCSAWFRGNKSLNKRGEKFVGL